VAIRGMCWPGNRLVGMSETSFVKAGIHPWWTAGYLASEHGAHGVAGAIR
jgi:hypothetical protein